MVKNISSYEIRKKRSNLIKKQEESGRSIHEMIDEIEGKIYNLKEEKDDSQILTEKCQKEISNIDKKIEEKSEEKGKYAGIWLSYIHYLEYFKNVKKIFHILFATAGGLSGIISFATTKDILDIPIALAAFATLDVCASLTTKIFTKNTIKKIKLKYFNNKHITEKEMQEIIKAKEKEIDPELDKLNETRRNLVNTQQETYQRIDKMSKEQEELEIDRKILIQEIVRNADKEDYIEDYLNDQIKEYYNLISKQSSSSEEKPKVQRKRFKEKVIKRRILFFLNKSCFFFLFVI